MNQTYQATEKCMCEEIEKAFNTFLDKNYNIINNDMKPSVTKKSKLFKEQHMFKFNKCKATFPAMSFLMRFNPCGAITLLPVNFRKTTQWNLHKKDSEGKSLMEANKETLKHPFNNAPICLMIQCMTIKKVQ